MPQGHYHFRAKVISRSQGRAICAAAAYRSGEKIHDEHYGKTFDYTPRTSIHATEIRAPAHAPDWMKDRSQLWNGVEAFETRKNSQLAREFEVSVPHELTAEQRKQAVRQFVDLELVSRGMVADVAYHDFTGKHSHNPHAHILVTMREIDGDSFARKKNRNWNTEETLTQWREAWARHANHALEQAQSQTRVDHRSYKERGINKTPVSESQGEWHQRQKEIAAANRQLEQANRELAALEKERKQGRQQLERLDAIMELGRLIARDDYERKAEREKQQKIQQKQSSPVPAPSHEPPPLEQSGTDEKQRIRQLLDQQADRERGESRAKDQSDQAAKLARDTSLEQQTASLKEAVAAFSAEVEKLRQSQPPHRKREAPKPEPQPPEEQEPEQKHGRSIGR